MAVDDPLDVAEAVQRTDELVESPGPWVQLAARAQCGPPGRKLRGNGWKQGIYVPLKPRHSSLISSAVVTCTGARSCGKSTEYQHRVPDSDVVKAVRGDQLEERV